MYEKSFYHWNKHLDFTLLDIVCMELAFWLAILFVKNGTSDTRYWHIAAVLIFVNIFVVFFYESYGGILKRGLSVECRKSFLHVLYVVGAMAAYLFMTEETQNLSRLAYGFFAIFYLCLTCAGRTLLKRLLQKRGRANRGNHSLFIMVNQDKAQEVVANIRANNFGEFCLVGIAILDAERIGQEIEGIPVVADRDGVLTFLKTHWIDQVFIHMEGAPVPQEVLHGCAEMGINVHIRLADKVTRGMNQTVEKLATYTVLTKSVRIVSAQQKILKRAMDIAGALVGLTITGIAYLFVAPIIRRESPGPVFFTQTRIGLNGKPFQMYKFRSMYLDAEERKKELLEQNQMEGGMMFKLEDDPRIIKGIGHFIRKTSIDELPQFWNVLKGDMSLVGTRPPTGDEWERYERHHRMRLAIKPGITGMWQANGRSTIRDFEKVVALDTQYILSWTLALDVKILLKTVGVVLKKTGAS